MEAIETNNAVSVTLCSSSTCAMPYSAPHAVHTVRVNFSAAQNIPSVLVRAAGSIKATQAIAKGAVASGVETR